MAVRLLLNLPAGEPIPVSEIHVVRSMGQAVKWRFVAALHPEQWGDQERMVVERLAKTLATSCKVYASVKGQGNDRLTPDVLVTGVTRWGEVNDFQRERTCANVSVAAHYIQIDAVGTSVERSPDSFIPRRVVHKVRDMKQLVGRLSHVAKPIGALINELEGVRFPDGGHASIIQDGVSDWQFLFHVFNQCRQLRSNANWVPLTLIGGVDESARTAGKWVISPGGKRAYEDWGVVAKRTIKFDDADERDGLGLIEFGHCPSAECMPAFPSGEVPSVVDWRPNRRFEPSRWKVWRTSDLPAFTRDGGMIWRIDDRLVTAAVDLEWKTATYSVPSDVRIVGPEKEPLPRPWVGLGTVETSSKKGPWIKVRLPGFETGNDIVDARLGTPFSGKDGCKGLHYVPEAGTEVLLSWTGRFDQSLIVVGNARNKEAQFPSPSVYLEDVHTAQFADISVKKIGETTVDSSLSLRVKQQTDVRSARPLEIRADGADLRLAGGVIYTGRGT